MIHPRVLLQADLISWQILVADMPQGLPPGRLSLLIILEFAGFRVVKPADISLKLLLRVGPLLLLSFLHRLAGDPPLCSLVVPHMG